MVFVALPTITASYAGDSTYAPSSGSAKLVYATNGGAAAVFCQSAIVGGPLAATGQSPINYLLMNSLLIILAMVLLIGVTYMIGYGFKLDRLIRFSRAELGEIAVTLIAVMVFLGGFSIFIIYQTLPSGTSVATLPGNFINLSPVSGVTPDIFFSDCESMATIVYAGLSNLISLWEVQQSDTFAQSYSFSLKWSEEGYSVGPLTGLEMSVAFITTIVTLTYFLIGLDVIIPGVLGVLFGILPIFLFVGIILRSFPWTRAAGGAFLGLFIGFYIIFPLLLYLLISAVTLTGFQAAAMSINDQVSNIGGGFNSFEAFVPSAQNLGLGDAISFVQNVLGQEFYVVFAVVVAFIIAYDFMEAAGDMLGAPSLSSSQALKNVI